MFDSNINISFSARNKNEGEELDLKAISMSPELFKNNMYKIFKKRKLFQYFIRLLTDKYENTDWLIALKKMFEESNIFHWVDEKNRIIMYHIWKNKNTNYFTYYVSLDNKFLHLPNNIDFDWDKKIKVTTSFNPKIYDDEFLIAKSKFFIKID